MRGPISQAPARLRIIRICRGLQALRQSDDPPGGTSSGGDTGFTAAAHRLEVDVLQVGSDRLWHPHRGTGAASCKRYSRRRAWRSSARLHRRTFSSLAAGSCLITILTVARYRRTCVSMPGHRPQAFNLDLTQDRRQPRHSRYGASGSGMGAKCATSSGRNAAGSASVIRHPSSSARTRLCANRSGRVHRPSSAVRPSHQPSQAVGAPARRPWRTQYELPARSASWIILDNMSCVVLPN